MRVSLTGGVALELLAPYFRAAGHEVFRPGTDAEYAFRPDVVYDVTAHDAALKDEVPGFFDERLRVLSGSPYSLDGIRAIVDEFGWSLLASPRKVLAVDADNTLWRGIISEDGVDAVRPYAVFQRGLRELRDAGVILVLLSKNDLDLMDRAPVDAALFADRRVNWAPKAGNLLAACRELNVGVESVVFVDDNPHERAQMAAHLPSVAVAPWNGFPEGGTAAAERQLVRRLREYFFSTSGTTAEDRLRAADYAARSARSAAALNFATQDDYLDDLRLWVEARPAEARDLDRLAQMAAKTNQFNATTLRRTREEFAALLEEPEQRVFVFRAGDRFGEQGVVCYVVVDLASRRITDFVMSCRAMGRTLEHFAYRHVAREVGFEPSVDFVKTEKNAPFYEFYRTLPECGPTRFHTIAENMV